MSGASKHNVAKSRALPSPPTSSDGLRADHRNTITDSEITGVSTTGTGQHSRLVAPLLISHHVESPPRPNRSSTVKTPARPQVQANSYPSTLDPYHYNDALLQSPPKRNSHGDRIQVDEKAQKAFEDLYYTNEKLRH